jgi:REP element-mobilizing transposase RayT
MRRLELAEREQGRLTVIERARIAEAFSLRLDHYLNEGYGCCLLHDERAAEIVKAALEYFDGERYELHAWCIMPNHVHVAMTPAPGHSLDRLLHSWKSYTAHRINEVLGRAGAVWQKEYFDRIVRDEDDMQNVIAYIVGDPAKAGLRQWRWVWSR